MRWRFFAFGDQLLLAMVFAALASNGTAVVDPPAGEHQSQLRYVQASDGLPTKGIWKSWPAVVNDGGESFLIAAHSLKGDGPRVWRGNGKEKWKESSEGLHMSSTCGGNVAFGDVNNDGRMDLAVADHCGGIFLYLNDGNGGWKKSVEALNPEIAARKAEEDAGGIPEVFTGSEAVALGDVNGDGFPDMVAASADQGGLTVYLGDGGSNWKEAKDTGLPTGENAPPDDDDNGGWATLLRCIDINNDGHLDVIASYSKGPAVWLGNGKGSFRETSQGLPRPSVAGLYAGFAVGDINEDGLPDLVAVNPINGIETYLQKNDGSWSEVPDVFPSLMGGASAVALADLTGDGHLDMLVTGRKVDEPGDCFGLFLLGGDGKGSFKEVPTNLPETGLPITWGLAVTEFKNPDGKGIILTTGQLGVHHLEIGRQKSKRTEKRSDPDSFTPKILVWLDGSRT